MTNKYSFFTFTIFLVASVKAIWFSFIGLNLFDYGESLHNGIRLIQGDVIYRDIWSTFPPADIYFPKFILQIFGEKIVSVRLVESLIFALFVLVIMLISRNLLKKIYLIFLAVAIIFFDFTTYAWYYYIFFYLSTLLTLLYFKYNKGYILLFAGVCLGIGSLFRHDTTIWFLISSIVSIFLFNRFVNTKLDISSSSKQIGIFLLGFLIVLLPVVFWLMRIDVLTVFIKTGFHDVLRMSPLQSEGFNFGYVFSAPIDLNKAYRLFTFFNYLVFILVYPATSIYLIRNFIRIKKVEFRDLVIISLLIIGIFQTPYAFSVVEMGHLIKGGVPALILGPYLVQVYLSKAKSILLSSVFTSIFIILIFGHLILNIWWIKFNNTIVTFKQGTILLNNAYYSGTTVPSALTIQEAVKFITSNSTENEYVFLAPYHAMIYFLSERRSPSRYNNFAAGYLNDIEQVEVIRDIERKKVNVVVYDPVNPPGNRTLSSHSPKLHKYIMENYYIVTKTPEGWLFMLKK